VEAYHTTHIQGIRLTLEQEALCLGSLCP
jgi:hypothetical protein